MTTISCGLADATRLLAADNEVFKL